MVFTVLQVVPELKVLEVFRQNGISYKHQKLNLLKLYKRYRPQLIYAESNQYQAVFPQELKDDYAMLPILAYNTGGEKHTWEVGVPSMVDYFENGQLPIPTGDKESMIYKEILFEELSAIIYEDGKVKSVGDHDDTVMSLWIAIQAAIEYFGSILQTT